MVTIRDVAKRAGVSVGTVSRVLAKNETVNVKIRDNVTTAIAELGYRPNLIARSLRSAQTSTIALVVPDIANPYFAQLALYVETAASKLGYTVVVANSHGKQALEHQQIDTLKSLFPAGFLIASAFAKESGERTGAVRTVAVDRPYGNHTLVATDHFAGGRLAARYLIGLGHRRIAYITGPKHLSVTTDRQRGFLSAFDEVSSDNAVGLMPPEVIEGDFGHELNEGEVLAVLLRKPSERPTAVATSNDLQAISLIRLARDCGISVPHELSVVGYDDVPVASLTIPRLTTISQPVQQIAERAVDEVLGIEQSRPLIMQPMLKQRETSLSLQ